MAEKIVYVPGKRGFPSDSEETPLHQKQNERQIRPKPNSSGSSSEDTIQNTMCAIAGANAISDNDPEVFNNSTQIDNLTVGELTKVVSGILSDPSFINKITSIMSQQVAITMNKTIQAACQKSIEPYAKKIQEQDETIKHLQSKMSVLENELEDQQQYSRRTSLRFNNVRLPASENGKVIFPVDTDNLVLNICNQDLEQNISLADIGRTHTIGKIKGGKASIIARFISYRKRQEVYSHKRKLKNHHDNTFVSENLTRKRFNLVRILNQHRKRGDINSYWTQDGRIIVKPHETSDRRQFVTVTSESDIYDTLGLTPLSVQPNDTNI